MKGTRNGKYKKLCFGGGWGLNPGPSLYMLSIQLTPNIKYLFFRFLNAIIVKNSHNKLWENITSKEIKRITEENGNILCRGFTLYKLSCCFKAGCVS
jgi:hypothetical protein